MLIGGFNMLSIEEILKISDDMGVEIRDNIENKHYIFNENGERVEFSVDMLMNVDEENTSSKIELQISTDYSRITFSSNYNLANCKNLYVSKSVSINESIIDAAQGSDRIETK